MTTRIPTLATAAALAVLTLAACGDDDGPQATTPAGTAATTTTAGATGPTGATGATGSEGSTTAGSEGIPIEELVALAAGVEPGEVGCGEEGIESVIGSAGTCAANGTEYIVADFGKKLELDSLTVRLADLQATDRVSGDYLKPRKSKNGTYVIGTLAVTNTGSRRELFDDFGEQVQLKAASATFSEPLNVLNGVATDSFLWKANKIKPGDTQVGKVVFDVPQRAVDELETEGSILVLNFADQGNPRRAEQVGLLRTG